MPTEVGLSNSRPADEEVQEPSGAYANDGGIDHVDAVNQIFAEFECAYHNQFHKAFAQVADVTIAKKYWVSSLEQYSPVQIIQAAKQVIHTQEYLPSIASVVTACEQGLDLFGLPSAHQAYIEACTAPSPKKDNQWSHEAVYHAGNAVGWFTLANESEARAFPRFDYHYGILCKRVINGESLHIDSPPALTERVERSLDKKESKARFAKLRKELGL